jgi:hypothetical protein
MKKLIKRLEDIMVAITFAEAGEYDEASMHAGPSVQEDLSMQLEGFKKTALENAGK